DRPEARIKAVAGMPLTWGTRSVHQHSARLDRTGPPFDFGWNEVGEICGAALIRWRHAVPDRFDSFSHRYSLQRVIRGLAQSAYDRIGGALGCKQSVPTGDDEFGKPLFGNCREVRQNGTPICSHKCNGLDRIALYLRHPRIDRLANEIDAAGNEILHRHWRVGIR